MIQKISLLLIIVIFTLHAKNAFSQVLETEDSNPLLPGQFEVGTAIEFQTSSQGTEAAIPLGLEYGVSNRFTLLVEPVAYTNIHPKSGKVANDIGDLEVTLFYQLLRERKKMPAISISAEVKFPTAKNNLIGTGKTDFTPFIIMMKEVIKKTLMNLALCLFMLNE
jgi:hypothetical protein